MKASLLILLSFTLYCYGFSQVYRDKNARVSDRVEDLINQMTLEEKIGQMTQAERGNIAASENEHIKTYFLGSVLSGGGSVPEPNTVEGWVAMYNAMQEAATSTQLGIPIIYGVDAVHGHNNLKNATIFPHNIGLGCTRNPELVEACARATALEVRATGANWTFSPCITVPQNEFWGRTYEGFGESPTLVDSMSKAKVLGYQTTSLSNENAVLACAKHFVGDGGTTNGHDQGNTEIDEETLRSIHLTPYYSAIEAGVGSVMASFNSWNGDKCHGNEYLLTDILKTEMGFEGFVVGDWNGIDQVDPSFKTAIQKSVNAGVDMGMQPNNYSQFIDNLIQLVNEGNVSMERIDDAVRRILTVKFEMGLFDNFYATLELKDSIGCKTHRTLARQAVRESVVMLKNDGIVPLSKNAGKILIAGSKANDIGAMCGGWTISWQGMNGEITEGTAIYQAVKDVVGSENVVFTSSASSIPDADYAIVVVGENPYAEGHGDILSATSFDLSNEDEALVSAIKNKGIPMVVVLLSGRPLDINSPLSTSNAFIAAWLPGSEGGIGIADVLFGDYSPTGKLSHTWPETYYDVPINITFNDGNTALFPYGYGLKYGEVSVEKYKTELNTLIVFPNPAQKEVRVTGNPESVLSIYDISGKLMIQAISKTKTNIIDISQLKTGIYLIKSGSLTQKLIVQ